MKNIIEYNKFILDRFEEIKKLHKMYDVKEITLDVDAYIIDNDHIKFAEIYDYEYSEYYYIKIKYFTEENWKEQYMKEIVNVYLEEKVKKEEKEKEVNKEKRRIKYIELKKEFEDQ